MNKPVKLNPSNFTCRRIFVLKNKISHFPLAPEFLSVSMETPDGDKSSRQLVEILS